MADINNTIDFPGGMDYKQNPAYDDKVMLYDPVTGKPVYTNIEDFVSAAGNNVIGSMTPDGSPSGSEVAGQSYRVSNTTGAEVEYTNFLDSNGDPVTQPDKTGGYLIKNADGWAFSETPMDTTGLASQAEVDAIKGGSDKSIKQVDDSVSVLDAFVDSISSVSGNQLSDSPNYIQKHQLLADGTFSESLSDNQLSVNYQPIPAGITKITISGLGTLGGATQLPRVGLKNASGEVISVITGLGTSTTITFDVPEDAVSYGFQVASGAGVGTDPSTSPYLTTIMANEGSFPLPFETYGVTKAFNAAKAGVATVEYVDSKITTSNALITKSRFPYASDGNDGDSFIDLRTGRLYSKANGSWGVGFNLGGKDTDFAYPAGFPWQPVTFKKMSNGWYIPSIQDIQEGLQPQIDALTPYYISPTGVSTNPGTKDLPFDSVATAFSKGARKIIALPGFYGRDRCLLTITESSSTDPFVLMAETDGTAAFSASDSASLYTWTADENVWSTTRSAVYGLMDTNTRDADGFFSTYTQLSDVASVKSMARSWCLIGSALTVNTGGDAPDAKIQIQMLLATTGIYTTGSNVPFAFFKGIEFYNISSTSQLNIKDGGTQSATKVYVKSCTFSNNTNGNGLGFDNIKEVWVQDCRGGKNRRDTFNYHFSKRTTAGYETPKVVQINCWSNDSGFNAPGETSSNGTTSHEGIIIIRIGGDFMLARGPVVADVNDGLQSLIFNVNASGAYGADIVPASFYINGVGSNMWLYSCHGFGSDYSALASGSATLYYDSETVLEGPTSGNVVAI